MRVQVLGTLELVTGGEGVVMPLRSSKLRRLLAALLVAGGEVCSTEALADVLWADSPPEHPDAALHNLVSRLRRDLSAAPELRLTTKPPGYALEVTAEAVDAVRFEHLVRAARPAVDTDPDGAAALLDEALSLWRGRPYAEFADEPFARTEVARLSELHASAVEDRAEAALRTGAPGVAVTGLERHVTVHPLRERPHQQLMLALYRCGRQAEALEVYRRLHTRLDGELGLEPSSELTALQEAILRQDPQLQPAPPPTPVQVTARRAEPPHEAPAGRSDDVSATVEEGLSRTRLVTLTGPGGVGKTTDALRARDRIRDRGTFPDGIQVVELAALTPDADLPAVVVTALEVQQRSGLTPVERLVEYLRPKSVLLVLDNCEHVVEQCALLVDALLGACPGVRVLATSREPLGVTGEQVLPVLPLDVPARGETDLQRVADSPAVRLLVQRAQEADPTFTLTRANAADVAELCRRLDGLPLAIELAAPRLRALTPSEITERLGDGHALLRNTRRLVAERHRTLTNVVAWSHHLLTTPEQQLFEVLGVFAGAFPLEDAEAVATAAMPGAQRPADIGGSLADLVDRSMVVARRRPGRHTGYQLLDTLRAYGRARLTERGELERVQRAHAVHHAALVRQLQDGMSGPDMAAAADRTMELLDELRSAHAWARTSDADLACRLVAPLFELMETRIVSEVGDWAEQCLEAARSSGRVPEELPDVAAVAAGSARFRGDFDRARAAVEVALRAAHDPDDPRRARALYIAGEVAGFEGALEESDHLMTAAMRVSTDAGGHVPLMGRVELALNHGYEGRIDQALEEVENVRRDVRAAGNPIVLGWCCYVEGELRQSGEPERATALIEEAIRRGRGLGDRYLTGVALVTLASLRGRHGDPDAAAGLFREAIEHWHRVGNRTQQWTTIRNVVELLERGRADRDAAVLLGAARSRRSGARAFGEEARRLQGIAERLATRLGNGWPAATGAGAALEDEAVVATACAALDRLVARG